MHVGGHVEDWCEYLSGYISSLSLMYVCDCVYLYVCKYVCIYIYTSDFALRLLAAIETKLVGP